jgi:hypothetical protein
MPRAAVDFWRSKTTLTWLGTTLTIAGNCILEHHMPTMGQWTLLVTTAMAAFLRDSWAKGLTGLLPGQPGDAVPTTGARSPEAASKT